MRILALAIALISTQAFAFGNKTICGKTDDRIPSNDPKIGRLLDSRSGSGGCTVTMISKSCAVSAGHCKTVLYVAEFNTPESVDGRIQHPEARDVYDIDQKSIQYTNNGPGDDWAVFKVLPNSVTGEYAGVVQGTYDVNFKKPRKGERLRITGYGLDRDEPTKNLAQQTNTGKLEKMGGVWSKDTTLNHSVDTMGGNSGSTIISEESGKIVGIHTHGGCSRQPGSANQGTLLAKHQSLVAAIKSCLNSDR